MIVHLSKLSIIQIKIPLILQMKYTMNAEVTENIEIKCFCEPPHPSCGDQGN